MPYADREISVYYTELGQGDPILFCHGAGGNSTIWWQQFNAFAHDYRCIAFDHRGFGRSECPVEAFDVLRYADDAVAVLDAAGVSRAHVVCQSMGGWTGARLALDHPHRVASLTLSGTIAGFALPEGRAQARSVAERVAREGGGTLALGQTFHQTNPTAAHHYQEISRFNTRIGQMGLYAQLLRDDVLLPVARLTDLDLPVQVIAGRDDAFWTPDVLRDLADRIPGARTVELVSGHSPYYEVPSEFNAVLRAFLTSL